MREIDILLVGVGGQGTILASRILAHVGQAAGYDIKVSEIHGMAQRGGSVVTQVRMGEKVYSPLIEEGRADVILAFEKLEALRWLSYLKPGGSLLVNDQAIYPVPVLAGLAQYPQDITGYLKAKVKDTVVLDALGTARECGNARAANVVLVGLLARRLPFAEDNWQEALAARVPARFLDVNRKAFAAGYGIG
ncbi:MAG: indolepyruvate oxidoreductase subunit beta [Peptococcaceae bacterium BICA1-7]|nr:MAG: indolepyruvate oxidoreductase subunit beta [Peptococcaceae bacterium BICA1-7]HBV96224.1 indolepyruvate oxidoreductase subunit beta [Desulfotomaculum sp.]